MNGEKDHPIDRLLAELGAAVARQDRGMLANVRRGFSEATEIQAYPHVAAACDLTDERQRRIVLTVAAGYATLAPEKLARSNVGNMGAAMRRLALEGGGKADEALSSFEGRFRRLLTCQNALELCDRLVSVLRAASAKQVPIDFRQLYWDLTDWERRDRCDVRVEWAQAYWGVRRQAETGEAA